MIIFFIFRKNSPCLKALNLYSGLLNKENLVSKNSFAKEKEMSKISKFEKVVESESNFMLEEFTENKNLAFPSENIKFFTQYN